MSLRGGAMPIATISVGKVRVKGFELNDGLLTVFECFEVVWPLDVAFRMPSPSKWTLD
jgi:hypothetical protein